MKRILVCFIVIFLFCLFIVGCRVNNTNTKLNKTKILVRDVFKKAQNKVNEIKQESKSWWFEAEPQSDK